MPKTALSRASLAALIIVTIAGCSSSGDGGTQPGPTPAIAISLGATSATVAQGGSTSVSATLTRSGGFSGTVAIAVQGVPAGVTGTLGNEQTSAGVTTATITIQVGAATAPGTYPLTVRGTGSGVSDATATFSLTVTATTPPGFALSAEPAAVSMAQGAAGSSTINVARTGGFTGAVGLTVQGAPVGLTATLTPASATGASSALALAAAANLAVGSYSLTITGAATGLSNQTTTVQVTITAGTGGGSGNVVIDFTGCGVPLWFAYQDGSGPWTVVPPTASRFLFSVSSNKAAFAYVLKPSQNLSQVYVQHMTRAELTAAPIRYCPTGTTTKVVNGTLAGLAQGDHGYVSLGGGSASRSLNGDFSMTMVKNGTHDLVAWRHHNLFATPDRGLIRRDLDIAANGSVGVVDLAGAESFAAVSAVINLTGIQAAETLNHGVSYWTGATCEFAILYNTQNASTSPFTAYGVPASVQRASDVHQLNVAAITGQGAPITGVTSVRGLVEWFHTMADRTVVMPAELGLATTTFTSSGYRRGQSQFAVPAEYNAGASFIYTSTGSTHNVNIGASAGWIGGPVATLSMPDFQGLLGWDNAWAPPTTGTGTWGAYATGSTISGPNVCQDGARSMSAYRLGTY